jgi:basic amino acid/polyamine antiporter, APA family
MTIPPMTEEPRELGFWVCTALIVGNTIGMGIFMMPASLAPYGLNALSGWLVTVAGCLTLAWVFAGLARSFPRDDGPYAYTLRAFGPATAYMVLWCYWVSVWVTNATLAVGVVGYLAVLFPALKSNAWWPPLTALGLIWFFVLLNFKGVRTVSWVQVLTTLLKLVPLLAVMVFGLWLFVTEPAAYSEHVPTTPATFDNLVQASTIALFAMLGIESATIPAGRVRDPERTIPRATLVGTLLLAVIYISVSIVPMLLLPQAELQASNAPFADLFEHQVGKGFGSVLAVFVVISGLGCLNGWTLLTGELTQSFARHGTFPAGLGVLNAHSAPSRAFMLTGVAASVMLLMNYSKSMTAGFTFFSVIVTAANLPLYLFCALAVLVLWRRGEIGTPGRREWVLFAAAILASVYSVWAFVGVGRESLLWALVLAAAGVPVYLWNRYGRRQA